MVDTNETNQSESPFREYANNVYFQPSVWDLTMIFGQLGLPPIGATQPPLEWGTAVTMPWAQAKIALYQLSLQVAFYEAENGRIHLHPNVIPPAPDLGKLDLPASVAAIQPELEELHAKLFLRTP